jgi:hypothetical protein
LNFLQNTFLICGYPRSRTLWLSHFFRIPGISVCEHEALEFAASSDEFWKNASYLAIKCGVKTYGNSDASNLSLLPALLARRPLTKVVWIDRPIGEVHQSMLNAGFFFNDNIGRVFERYHAMYEDFFDLVIPYRKLSEMTTMRLLWQLVLPDVEFDYGRWGQLADKVLRYDSTNYDMTNPERIKKLLEFTRAEGEIIWV